MINNRFKGLEYILIPLFGLLTQSCDNKLTRYEIITTDEDTNYFVTIDKDSTIIATVSINPGGLSIFYKFIDVKGDGIVDTSSMFVGYNPVSPPKNKRAADFSDRAQYQMHVYPEIKKIMLKGKLK